MNLSIVAPISESSMSGRLSVMHSSNSTRTAERFWRPLALTRFSAKFLHIRRAYARSDSGFCGGIVFQSAMQVSLKHSSASCRLPVISFAAQMQRRLFSYECHTTKDGVNHSDDAVLCYIYLLYNNCYLTQVPPSYPAYSCTWRGLPSQIRLYIHGQ